MFYGCQPQYQQHHSLCPHGRQPLPVSSPLPPSSAAPGDGSPSDSRCDGSQDDGGGGGAAMDDALAAPPRNRRSSESMTTTTTVAPCRTEDVMTVPPPPPPPDVTASKSTKAPQNHYLWRRQQQPHHRLTVHLPMWRRHLQRYRCCRVARLPITGILSSEMLRPCYKLRAKADFAEVQ